MNWCTGSGDSGRRFAAVESGMKWVEEYSCGCFGSAPSKKRLVGYCAKHGHDRRNLYKETGDDRVLIPIERTITPHDQEAG